MFEARAIVFDGSDDYHQRINDPALGIIGEDCIRPSAVRACSAGRVRPRGGRHEPLSDALLERGIESLPTLGDGRQSGTSDNPSILSYIAGKRGGRRTRLAALRRHRTASTSMPGAAMPWSRRLRSPGERPAAATPELAEQYAWEELFREKTGQLAEGGVLEFAVGYCGTSNKTPRHNH